MKLFFYELVKVGKKRIFLLAALALLAGNLITLYSVEKHELRFYYVHVQREAYEAVLSGGMEPEESFYLEERNMQEEHIASYPAFIDEMEQRAERMKQSKLYQKKDSFVYRNLEKSCEDYAPFSGIALKMDNCYGLYGLADYGNGILFFLIFAGIAVYYILFWERDQNLTLLLKGNKYGHVPLAIAKLMTLLSVIVLYVLLQEILTIGMFGNLYGYGDLSRVLQSVYLFRNSVWSLTVGEMLLMLVGIRIGIAVWIGAFLYCLGMIVRSGAAAVGLAALGLGAEYICSSFFSIDGSMNILKSVNPFYFWNAGQAFGEYHNLNIFGYPIAKEQAALIAGTVTAVVFLTIGITAFHKICQIKAGNGFERIFVWLRKRLAFLNGRTGVLGCEFNKVMIQQKKIVILALFFLFGINGMISAFDEVRYGDAATAAYHYYVGQIQGKVTDDTYRFIEKEQAYLDECYRQLAETDEGGMDPQIAMYEIERREEGFHMVVSQLDYLENNLPKEERFVVDELAYEDIWENVGWELRQWFIGAAVVFILIGGVYALDIQKNMNPLLHATYYGRKRLNRSKNLEALLLTGIVYLFTELPLFWQYYRIDHFDAVSHGLNIFSRTYFQGNAAIGVIIFLVFTGKLLIFLLACMLGLFLQRPVRNETLSIVICIGIAGALAVVCSQLHFDVQQFVLQVIGRRVGTWS